MHMFMDYSIYVKNVCLNLQRFLEVVYTYLILKICSQSKCKGNKLLPNTENLVSEATRNSLRIENLTIFLGEHAPKPP